jgi:hypothetical protein
MKMTKEEKRIEKYSEYFRENVFGQTSGLDHHLEAMGVNSSGYSHVSDRVMLEAQGRLLVAIAEDISAIYAALGIGQKEKEQFDSNVKLVRKKAEDYIKELDAANAEQKRKRELKKLSVNRV